MKVSKIKAAVVLAAAVLFTACAGRTKETKADTPREAAEQVMTSIKELDLKTFNAYTDNYEGTRRNFKVFQELLQFHVFESKRYKEKYRFARKVVEELDWEIGEVKEQDGGREARIEMTITNRDMARAIERYTMWVMEEAVNEAGIGAASLAGNISWTLNQCDDDLIRFIDETEHTRTDQVSVTAYQEDGGWKLKLTDEFINAFMGNMDSEEYDEELEEHMDELLKKLEDDYVEKIGRWSEGIGEIFE